MNNKILQATQQNPQHQLLQQPPLQMIALNDIHLIALIAASRSDLQPAEAVKWAGQIVMEAVKQNESLQKLVNDWKISGV